MDLLSILVGTGGGAVVGFFVAGMLATKAKTALEDKIRDSDKAVTETSNQLRDAQREREVTQKSLESEKDRGKKSAAQIKDLQGQADASAKSVATAEKAREKAEAAAAQAKVAFSDAQASLKDAESRAQAAQTRAQAAETKAQSAAAQATTAAAEAKKAAQRASDLESSVTDLKAQLAAAVAAGANGANGASDADAQSGFSSSGSLEETLRLLLEREGQRAAVLADGNGIVVASAGQQDLRDGMAAASQVMSSLTTQLQGLVPLNAVRSFLLQDTTSVISGRTFECAGEMISLATFGDRVPASSMMDGAMANLNAALE